MKAYVSRVTKNTATVQLDHEPGPKFPELIAFARVALEADLFREVRHQTSTLDPQTLEATAKVRDRGLMREGSHRGTTVSFRRPGTVAAPRKPYKAPIT